MDAQTATSYATVRAGVFERLDATQRAVQSLLGAGFSAEQITVVCSDETKERHFKQFERQQPAGRNAPASAAAGGTLGAALGGAAAAAVGIAVGGPAFVVLGGAGLITGALVGGFLGAMLTRGMEKEAANFYDQAVQSGKLLVVVEDHHDGAESRLAKAERLLAAAGAEPLPLSEG
jgi:hypothetical protein